MENKKIRYIQGIRAVVSICIALVHFFGRFYQDANYFLVSQTGRILLAPFRGSVGVVFFAIIAGYFAISYAKKHPNLGEYLLKRYSKMWISVLIIGVVWYFLSKTVTFLGVNISSQFAVFEKYTSLHQYVINSFFINDRILGVFWPLLSIFIGTTIVALTGKYVTNNFHKVVVLLAFSFVTFYTGNRVIDIVCFGGIFGLLENSSIIEKIKNSNWKYLIFVIGWLVISYDDKATRSGYIILAIGAILLLIAIQKIKFINKFLSNNFFIHIGNISFEIYCVHFVLVTAMIVVCELIGYNYYHNFPKLVLLVFAIVYFFATYVFSLIFKKVVSFITKKINVFLVKISNIFKEYYLIVNKTIDEKDTWFFIVIGVFLIFLSAYVSNSSMGTKGYLGIYSMDYGIHNKAADTIFDGIQFAPNMYLQVVYTYPLYHATSKIISIFTGFDIHFSSSVAICLYVFFTIMLIRQFLLSSNKSLNKNIVNAISISSVILMNLYIPSFVPSLFFPQGAPNLWHNPTFLVARPFALIATLTFVNFLKNNNLSKKDCLYMSLSLFLSLFAKPNYALVFYPISGLLIFIKFCLNPKTNFKHLLYWGLAIIPSIALNLFQFSHMYLLERTGGTLLELKWPIFQGISYLLLLIIFPLFVFVTEGYKKYKDPLNLFVWGAVILGWLEYFITVSADFIWGYEMSVFMLFVYSAKLLFIDSDNKKMKIIGASIWIVQVIIGIVYFFTGVLGSSLIY